MIGSLQMAPLLAGFRDAPPLDVAALTDVLHRVARLAADLPSVAELDINPLILCPSGCPPRHEDPLAPRTSSTPTCANCADRLGMRQ